jgi:hypothetical protein
LYQDTVLFKTFYIAIIWKRRYITSWRLVLDPVHTTYA